MEDRYTGKTEEKQNRHKQAYHFPQQIDRLEHVNSSRLQQSAPGEFCLKMFLLCPEEASTRSLDVSNICIVSGLGCKHLKMC
jgi:hypothetical protein